MKILYISSLRYLSSHFLNGWKNCFERLGYGFKYLNPDVDNNINEYLKSHKVDFLFTYSNEGLIKLDHKILNKNQIKLVVGALPYNRFNISFDKHCPLMGSEEINILEKVDNKIVWSQHEPEFNDFFYSGFLTRDIPVIYLPHCADITQIIELRYDKNLNYDLFFIGNLGHKKNNIKLLKTIFSYTDIKKIKIIGDKLWKKYFNIKIEGSTKNEEWKKYYSQSLISINLHTKRQKKHQVLLNDRTFHIPIYGGFQICDNPLANKFFKNDEIIVAENEKSFIEFYNYFRTKPDERFEYIKKGYNRVVKDHSYFNRWLTILSHFDVKYSDIYLKTNIFSDHINKSLDLKQIMNYYIESKSFQFAKKIKKWIQK